jgi:conjugal transfer/type IV secretion protein DotA/TraY
MNRFLLCSFIILLFFSAGSQAAFISDVFQPSPTDASVQNLLKPLFGGLVDEAMGNGGGDGGTALTNIIKFLLVNIIVPFGGLLLLYSTYVGISMSAMTAELFGDKKAAFWVAVRTVIGFGMVAPAPMLKGIALVNLFLMWITLHGVGGSSSEWGVVVDEFTKNPIILASSAPDTTVFDAMLRGEMCAAIYNDAVTQAGENPLPADQLKTWTILFDAMNRRKIGWIKPGWNGLSDGHCGYVYIKRDAEIGVDAHITGTKELGSLKAARIAGEAAQSEMQAQTDDVLNALHTRAAEVAKMVIDSGNVIGADQPPAESYFALMEWYRTKQQQAAKSIADSAMPEVTSAFKTAAKQEGWATAGFYFIGLSTFQQVINHAINMSWVTGKSTTLENVTSMIADETLHANANGQWMMMESYISAGHQQIAAGQSLPGTATDLDDDGGDIMAWVGKKLNDQVISSMNSNATPLAAAIDIGSTLLDVGSGLAIGGTAANYGGKYVPGIWGKAVSKLGDKAWEIGKILWITGFVLTAVGILPALAWGRRVLHWTIRVIVAQIAGPIWMVMHIHHAGDGLEGNAGNGYRLALQLFLAPVLDITALAMVYVLMIVFMPFMNATVMPIILSLGSGALTLVSVFIVLCLNVWLVFELLALFEKFEHEVLAFVGGRGSDLSMDSQGSDSRRMLAVLNFANKKMPAAKLPNFGGQKDSGASITSDKKENVSKITNDHLMPKDK